MKRSLMTLATAITLLGMGAAAPAAMINLGTMDQYVSGGTTFTLDGLTFSDFSISGVSTNPAKAIDNPSEVSLYGEVLPSGRVILGFTAGWDTSIGETSDSHIRFKVTATSPTSIIGNLLDFTAYSMASPDGVLSITENVTDTGGAAVADKYVRIDSGMSKLSDYQLFSTEQQVIWVDKDVYLFGGTDTGFVHMSGFEQGFDTEVPEPGTLAILAAGGVLVAQARRRRKA